MAVIKHHERHLKHHDMFLSPSLISVKGVLHFYKDKKRHVITTQTEHKCVLDSCRHLQQEGFEVTYLPVKSNGIIDLDQLRSAIRPDTGLVLVMAVNNEIRVIQPMEEVGQTCKEFNVPFHTDAAQVWSGFFSES